MYVRIGHIAVMLISAAFLTGGCTDRRALDADGAEISFGVATVRLEAETKLGGTLHVNFTDGDGDESKRSKIAVYAWHEQERMKVFDNVVVRLEDDAQTLWSYSPKKKWRWGSGADSYDFLAVANPDAVTDIALPKQDLYVPSAEFPGNVHPVSRKDDDESPFTLSVSYDATYAQYDLLMAGVRRSTSESNPSAKVPLVFQHALSAVKVKFIKDSGGADFRVTAFHFYDLMVRADIEASLSPSLTFSKAAVEYSPDPEFGEEKSYDSATPVNTDNPTYEPYGADNWALLLPQSLRNGANGRPTLIVTFNTSSEVSYTREIRLDQILDEHGQIIDEWLPGRKYVYEIHILMDGGVLVNVTTTPWEEVEAATPGLMI